MAEGVDSFQSTKILFAGEIEILEHDMGILAALPLEVDLVDGRPEAEGSVLVNSVQDLGLDLGYRITV